MLKVIRSSLLLSIFLVLFGCSSGKDFVRPNSDSLKLGQTTYAQVVHQLGDPSKTKTVVLNGENVNEMTYVFASGSLPGGIATARAMTLGIYKDVLVSNIFMSSFKEDSTFFESDKVSDIEKGKTTKDDIENMFGKRHGEGLYPFAKQKDGKSMTYLYSETRNVGIGALSSFKRLIVQLDRDGIVTDYNFSTSGKL